MKLDCFCGKMQGVGGAGLLKVEPLPAHSEMAAGCQPAQDSGKIHNNNPISLRQRTRPWEYPGCHGSVPESWESLVISVGKVGGIELGSFVCKGSILTPVSSLWPQVVSLNSNNVVKGEPVYFHHQILFTWKQKVCSSLKLVFSLLLSPGSSVDGAQVQNSIPHWPGGTLAGQRSICDCIQNTDIESNIEYQNIGKLKHRNVSILEYQRIGMLKYLNDGIMEYQDVRILDYFQS